MAHPDVRTMGNRVDDLSDGATQLLDDFQKGDRPQDMPNKLRRILKETRGLIRLYDQYEKSQYVGLETWRRTKMIEIITICEVTLRELVPEAARPDTVPQAFRAALASNPAE